MTKPFAPAAERNKQAILLAMQAYLQVGDSVFEFGSGTGQHACHIAAAIPQLAWQPSDLPDKLPGIRQWITDSGCGNIFAPVALDLNEISCPDHRASVCFTANTLHIISWKLVESLFKLSATILNDNGKLCIYGPFAFDGEHTSESNVKFDQQLRDSDPASGIRDVMDLQGLANRHAFSNLKVIDMPANNHLLVWEIKS